MAIFEYIAAILMLVLGLGVTQLLSDAVDAFRRRQTVALHWIPLTWAAIVFAWQMQYLWAVFELQTIEKQWTPTDFTIMLVLALLLFVAGSLVIPKATDEEGNAMQQFLKDGRWTLLILSVFFFLAYFANVVLFQLSPWDLINLDDLILGFAMLFTTFTKSQRSWSIATVVLGICSILAIFNLSPTSYS